MPLNYSSVTNEVYFLGGGGYAGVLAEECAVTHDRLRGILDPQLTPGTKVGKICVLGGDSYLDSIDPESAVALVNAIGASPNRTLRQDIFRKYIKKGFRFKTIVSASAVVQESVQLSQGVQVLAGAVLQANVKIGANSVINTSTSIDHDCIIEEDCWISPGTTICGNVVIQKGCYIGAGSIILENVEIAYGSFIRAGSLVTKAFAKEIGEKKSVSIMPPSGTTGQKMTFDES